MTRIGIVTKFCDPEEEDSAAVAGTISRSLVALGHERHVLTGFPAFPTGRTINHLSFAVSKGARLDLLERVDKRLAHSSSARREARRTGPQRPAVPHHGQPVTHPEATFPRSAAPSMAARRRARIRPDDATATSLHSGVSKEFFAGAAS